MERGNSVDKQIKELKKAIISRGSITVNNAGYPKKIDHRLEKQVILLEAGAKVEVTKDGFLVNDKFVLAFRTNSWRYKNDWTWYQYKGIKSFINEYISLNACTPLNTIREQKSEYITKEDFNEFWKLYPKKANKGQALRVWERLCMKGKRDNHPKLKELISSLNEHIVSKKWENYQFIPNAVTWLAEYRWLDDPKEFVPFTTKTIDKVYLKERLQLITIELRKIIHELE